LQDDRRKPHPLGNHWYWLSRGLALKNRWRGVGSTMRLKMNMRIMC